MDTPNILKHDRQIAGTTYIKDFTFNCNKTVPVFEINSIHGLNQIIGYAKFINKEYGNVYYRGQNQLYNTLLPSLFRNTKAKTVTLNRNIGEIINKIKDDDKFSKELQVKEDDKVLARAKIEGMLQHYGVPTRCIDIVDNHWVALWMGLYSCQDYKQSKDAYHRFVKRELVLGNYIQESDSSKDDNLYQFVLLLALPQCTNKGGVMISNNLMQVELRQALPSIFLRPHAQHGLVVSKKVKNGNENVENYDLASEVIGVLKIRIDRVNEWLGNGTLLTQDNLFPAPAFDIGYDLLLNRVDFFPKQKYSIAKYI